MKRSDLRKPMTATAFGTLVFSCGLMTAQAAPTATAGASAEHARIIGHWTPARVAAAIPRDLVIDEHGQGYLKKPDGSLEPYGNRVAEAAGRGQTPNARPVGDTAGPVVTPTDPADGAVIGASHTFKATVTDALSTVRSVSFKIGRAGGQAQSFTGSHTANGVYTASLQGFTDGDWSWYVVAKDSANNTTTTDATSFTVSTSGVGGGGTGVVTNSEWTTGGLVQTAAGRIYFEMPSNSRRTRWAGYVCSGTVASDGAAGRSVIQTAAHCVYDDVYKAFARNVMFIPNQAGGGSGTDLNCSNDPLGCWTPSFGVVDVNWTTRTFPDNVAWDYAYYVVPDTGAHTGAGGGANLALDATAGSLPINFGVPLFEISGSGDYTHALGYSYSDDPNFMYCAEDMTQLDGANWWLGSCGLSGGSSGGLWAQPMNPDTGVGTIISVNSWGYTNQPGMAGPKLSGNSASCVFGLAKTGNLAGTPAAGDAGLKFSGACP